MTSRTIFIAEDDDDLRAMLCHLLRADGYDVVEARDGAELLDLLADAETSRPDVILTDVLMPCYSGMGVLGALHRTDWRVPVIVMTARRDDELIHDALRLGAVAVFRKPFDVTDLRAAIASANMHADRGQLPQ